MPTAVGSPRTPALASEVSAPREAATPRAPADLAAAWLAGVAVSPLLARVLAEGAGPGERAAAAQHLAEAPIDLPDNRALRVELRRLRTAGRVELDDARAVIAAAGRLSTAEQRAIGETLLAAELARGVAPDAAAHLRAHLADERLARTQDRRSAAVSAGAFTALSVASGGVGAASAAVLAGLSFGGEPVASAIMMLTTLFGLSSVLGCAKIAVDRAVDAGTYGRED